MNGCVIPDAPIAVDFWKVLHAPHVRYFFLTHMHGDHIVGLSPSWAQNIYCSPTTKQLLLHKFKGINGDLIQELEVGASHLLYLDEEGQESMTVTVIDANHCPGAIMYNLILCLTDPQGINSDLIQELEVGVSHLLYLDEEGQESMTVTVLDANHCPGAVMYMFEGYFGTILYTGDFRYDPGKHSNHKLLRRKCIDVLYVDNTYCAPSCVFPTREQAKQQIIDIIHRFTDHNVVIGMRNLGKEDLLVDLAQHFRTWIVVEPWRLELIKVLDLPNVFTKMDSVGRISTVNWTQVNSETIKLYNYTHPTIAILPTALYSTDTRDGPASKHKQVFNVAYSDHSSYRELMEFVAVIKPKKVIPIVQSSRSDLKKGATDRANMKCFQTFLDPNPRKPVIIPKTVATLFERGFQCVTRMKTDPRTVSNFVKNSKPLYNQSTSIKSGNAGNEAGKGVLFDSPPAKGSVKDRLSLESSGKGGVTRGSVAQQNISAGVAVKSRYTQQGRSGTSSSANLPLSEGNGSGTARTYTQQSRVQSNQQSKTVSGSRDKVLPSPGTSSSSNLAVSGNNGSRTYNVNDNHPHQEFDDYDHNTSYSSEDESNIIWPIQKSFASASSSIESHYKQQSLISSRRPGSPKKTSAFMRTSSPNKQGNSRRSISPDKKRGKSKSPPVLVIRSKGDMSTLVATLGEVGKNGGGKGGRKNASKSRKQAHPRRASREGDSEVTTTGEDVASVKTRGDVAPMKNREDVAFLKTREDIAALKIREDAAPMKNREDVAATKTRKDVVKLRRPSAGAALNSDVKYTTIKTKQSSVNIEGKLSEMIEKLSCKWSPGAKNTGNDSGKSNSNSVNESNKDKTTKKKGKLSKSSSTSSLKSSGRTNNEDLNPKGKGKSNKKRKRDDKDGIGKTENSGNARTKLNKKSSSSDLKNTRKSSNSNSPLADELLEETLPSAPAISPHGSDSSSPARRESATLSEGDLRQHKPEGESYKESFTSEVSETLYHTPREWPLPPMIRARDVESIPTVFCSPVKEKSLHEREEPAIEVCDILPPASMVEKPVPYAIERFLLLPSAHADSVEEPPDVSADTGPASLKAFILGSQPDVPMDVLGTDSVGDVESVKEECYGGLHPGLHTPNRLALRNFIFDTQSEAGTIGSDNSQEWQDALTGNEDVSQDDMKDVNSLRAFVLGSQRSSVNQSQEVIERSSVKDSYDVIQIDSDSNEDDQLQKSIDEDNKHLEKRNQTGTSRKNRNQKEDSPNIFDKLAKELTNIQSNYNRKKENNQKEVKKHKVKSQMNPPVVDENENVSVIKLKLSENLSKRSSRSSDLIKSANRSRIVQSSDSETASSRSVNVPVKKSVRDKQDLGEKSSSVVPLQNNSVSESDNSFVESSQGDMSSQMSVLNISQTASSIEREIVGKKVDNILESIFVQEDDQELFNASKNRMKSRSNRSASWDGSIWKTAVKKDKPKQKDIKCRCQRTMSMDRDLKGSKYFMNKFSGSFYDKNDESDNSFVESEQGESSRPMMQSVIFASGTDSHERRDIVEISHDTGCSRKKKSQMGIDTMNSQASMEFDMIAIDHDLKSKYGDGYNRKKKGKDTTDSQDSIVFDMIGIDHELMHIYRGGSNRKKKRKGKKTKKLSTVRESISEYLASSYLENDDSNRLIIDEGTPTIENSNQMEQNECDLTLTIKDGELSGRTTRSQSVRQSQEDDCVVVEEGCKIPADSKMIQAIIPLHQITSLGRDTESIGKSNGSVMECESVVNIQSKESETNVMNDQSNSCEVGEIALEEHTITGDYADVRMGSVEMVQEKNNEVSEELPNIILYQQKSNVVDKQKPNTLDEEKFSSESNAEALVERVKVRKSKRIKETEIEAVETGIKPVKAMSKTVTTGTKPLNVIPVKTTSKPVTTSTKPVTTGTKPLTTGTKPLTTGTKPLTTGTKPLNVETEPVCTRMKPIESGLDGNHENEAALDYFFIHRGKVMSYYENVYCLGKEYSLTATPKNKGLHKDSSMISLDEQIFGSPEAEGSGARTLDRDAIKRSTLDVIEKIQKNPLERLRRSSRRNAKKDVKDSDTVEAKITESESPAKTKTDVHSENAITENESPAKTKTDVHIGNAGSKTKITENNGSFSGNSNIIESEAVVSDSATETGIDSIKACQDTFTRTLRSRLRHTRQTPQIKDEINEERPNSEGNTGKDDNEQLDTQEVENRVKLEVVTLDFLMPAEVGGSSNTLRSPEEVGRSSNTLRSPVPDNSNRTRWRSGRFKRRKAGDSSNTDSDIEKSQMSPQKIGKQGGMSLESQASEKSGIQDEIKEYPEVSNSVQNSERNKKASTDSSDSGSNIQTRLLRSKQAKNKVPIETNYRGDEEMCTEDLNEQNHLNRQDEKNEGVDENLEHNADLFACPRMSCDKTVNVSFEYAVNDTVLAGNIVNVYTEENHGSKCRRKGAKGKRKRKFKEEPISTDQILSLSPRTKHKRRKLTDNEEENVMDSNSQEVLISHLPQSQNSHVIQEQNQSSDKDISDPDIFKSPEKITTEEKTDISDQDIFKTPEPVSTKEQRKDITCGIASGSGNKNDQDVSTEDVLTSPEPQVCSKGQISANSTMVQQGGTENVSVEDIFLSPVHKNPHVQSPAQESKLKQTDKVEIDSNNVATNQKESDVLKESDTTKSPSSLANPIKDAVSVDTIDNCTSAVQNMGSVILGRSPVSIVEKVKESFSNSPIKVLQDKEEISDAKRKGNVHSIVRVPSPKNLHSKDTNSPLSVKKTHTQSIIIIPPVKKISKVYTVTEGNADKSVGVRIEKVKATELGQTAGGVFNVTNGATDGAVINGSIGQTDQVLTEEPNGNQSARVLTEKVTTSELCSKNMVGNVSNIAIDGVCTSASDNNIKGNELVVSDHDTNVNDLSFCLGNEDPAQRQISMTSIKSAVETTILKCNDCDQTLNSCTCDLKAKISNLISSRIDSSPDRGESEAGKKDLNEAPKTPTFRKALLKKLSKSTAKESDNYVLKFPCLLSGASTSNTNAIVNQHPEEPKRPIYNTRTAVDRINALSHSGSIEDKSVSDHIDNIHQRRGIEYVLLDEILRRREMKRKIVSGNIVKRKPAIKPEIFSVVPDNSAPFRYSVQNKKT